MNAFSHLLRTYTHIQVTLYPISNWSELRPSVTYFLTRFHELNSRGCQLDLSDNNLRYLTVVHRAIQHPR